MEIRGNGTFNESEVRQWLTKDGTDYPGLAVGIEAVDMDKDDDNSADITQSSADTAVEALFKTNNFGGDTIIEHAIDLDGKRLRLAINEHPSNIAAGDATTDNLVLVADGTDAADGATNRYAGAGSVVKFNLTDANQAFNLVSGSESTITAAVGALRNASYTADPETTNALFTLGKLFDLQRDREVQTPEAKVKFAYNLFGENDSDNTFVYGANEVQLRNLTSNQNLNLEKVTLKLEGEDLSVFKTNTAGDLVDQSGNPTGLKLSADGTFATGVAGADVREGDLDGSGDPQNQALVDLAAFTRIAVDSDNKTGISAQDLKLSATILGSDQDTFNDFTSNLLDLYYVTRDGLKFDTILTGTTSANTIHIRDISGGLPEDGGKIYVTIVEYDAHGVDQNAEGNELAKRQELGVKLPSGGAVTLSPAGVAEMVGAEINPQRQARLVFEVETNVGEVAVKKQTDKGTDIQTGSQAADSAGIVDYTL